MVSRTALRVALRRAAHQVYDPLPRVLDDPFAVPILGPYAAELERTPGMGRRPSTRDRSHSLSLRAFLVARSRYAEDTLAEAVAHRGATQYVLLGAGLDTFILRNPFAGVRVLELDHPTMQGWKRKLLAGAGLSPTGEMRFIPADLAEPGLRETLYGAGQYGPGLDPQGPAVFAALGVVPYLQAETFVRVLELVAGHPAGATLVFDYTLPREVLGAFDQMAHDSMGERVRAVGEPFQLHMTQAEVAGRLAAAGLTLEEDIGSEELNARYFAGREDELRISTTAARLVRARVGGSSE